LVKVQVEATDLVRVRCDVIELDALEEAVDRAMRLGVEIEQVRETMVTAQIQRDHMVQIAFNRLARRCHELAVPERS